MHHQMPGSTPSTCRRSGYAEAPGRMFDFPALCRSAPCRAMVRPAARTARLGDQREAIADRKAQNGSEPGVSYHTHMPGRYGPFHTKVIADTKGEAPHVLDYLLSPVQPPD
jgi:hypothetical protein